METWKTYLSLGDFLELIPGDKFLAELDKQGNIYQKVYYSKYKNTEIELGRKDTEVGIIDDKDNILFVYNSKWLTKGDTVEMLGIDNNISEESQEELNRIKDLSKEIIENINNLLN